MRASPERRAEILFYEAIERLRSERDDFLNEACHTDAGLRTEVNELLRAHDEAAGFLPENAPASPELETQFVRMKPEIVGERIGPYKLLEQIGEGGFGVVWVAEQEKPVRRRVALKIIKLGMDTKEVIARFEQERQALAMMDHPNIAKVLDAGATDMGRPYFVMELVRGIKITKYCDQANLPTAERLRLFIAVCHAVQHAHQKGIIHRDLKPSNILVTLHDGVPVPKVIDFGIAKATQQQRLTDLTIYTQFEQMVGTPLYMSPEQAEMSGLDIDTRSDIYSLGVLLYELLVGRTPFDPETLMKRGLDEIRRVVREQEPQRPSTFVSTMAVDLRTNLAQHRQTDSAKLIGQIRGDLDWIVMKALEKDRARRYETANNLAEDIQRHLVSEPIQARPATQFYRFRRMVKRNKAAFAATAAVISALLVGLGVSTWMYFKAAAAETAQSEERQRAEIEAKKSREVARFLRDMLNSVGPSVAQGADTKLLREILDNTAERVGKDLKDQPAVEVELRSTLGEVYRQLGDLGKAAAIHRQALKIAREIWGSEHQNVATSLGHLAHVLADDGKSGEAETLQREALSILRKLRGKEHPYVAKALDKLGGILRLEGRLAEAESLHREALAMGMKLLGDDHQDVTASFNNLAVVLKAQGKLAEAETIEREVLAMARKQHGINHPHVASTLSNLASMLGSQKKLVEAAEMHREALGIQLKLYGNEDRHVATTLNNLACVLEEQGELTEAESIYNKVLAMRRKLLGNEHLEVAASLNNLAILLERKKMFSEAETMHREALTMKQKLLRDGHPDLALSLYNLASVLVPQGKLTEAESLHRQALAISRKELGDGHPQVGRIFSKLARLQYDQGKLEEFESVVREELESVRGLTVPNPPRLESILADLAQHLYRQGKYATAETLYRELIESRQTQFGAEDDKLLGPWARLGRLLTDWAWNERNSNQDSTGHALEAERILRNCLEIILRKGNASSNDLASAEFRNRLGSALVSVAVTDAGVSSDARLAKLAEAEQLLIESNGALQPRPDAERENKRDSLVRIVRLYEAWQQPVKAAAWRQKLSDFEKAGVTK